MARRKKRKDIRIKESNPYYREAVKLQKTFSKLLSYRQEWRVRRELKKWAKVADQRMVRLEQLAQQPGYQNVMLYAYRRAGLDIARYSKEGQKPRFNRGLKKLTLQQMKSRLVDIERFLLSETSTKHGIVASYERRAESLNKNLELDVSEYLTWEDMQNVYASDALAAAQEEEQGGSDTIVRAIGAIKRKYSTLTKDDIKEAKKGTLHLSDDDIVNKYANALLAHGFDPSEMFTN